MITGIVGNGEHVENSIFLDTCLIRRSKRRSKRNCFAKCLYIHILKRFVEYYLIQSDMVNNRTELPLCLPFIQIK